MESDVESYTRSMNIPPRSFQDFEGMISIMSELGLGRTRERERLNTLYACVDFEERGS